CHSRHPRVVRQHHAGRCAGGWLADRARSAVRGAELCGDHRGVRAAVRGALPPRGQQVTTPWTPGPWIAANATPVSLPGTATGPWQAVGRVVHGTEESSAFHGLFRLFLGRFGRLLSPSGILRRLPRLAAPGHRAVHGRELW